MAGEWMQIDIDIMEKPEFLRIVEITGEADELVLFRLVKLWSWVERATTDGFFPGLTVNTLARKFSGTPEFWQALADPAVDWLWIHEEGLQIPRYEKRFDKSAKRRAQDARQKAKSRAAKAEQPKPAKRGIVSPGCRQNDDQQDSKNKKKNLPDQSNRQTASTPSPKKEPPDCPDQGKGSSGKKAQGELFTEVELSKVMEVAEELFRQAKYSGDDGGIFYKAAAVLETNPGKLTRHQLVDAARGCRGSRNAPGYFRQTIRNICPEFDQLSLGVWIEPRWPQQPPNRIPRQSRDALQLRGVPLAAAEGDSIEESRRKVLSQLEAIGT